MNESAGRGDVAQARTRRRLLEEVEADVADDIYKGSCAVWCQKAPEFGTAESVLESVLNAGQTQHSSATFFMVIAMGAVCVFASLIIFNDLVAKRSTPIK